MLPRKSVLASVGFSLVWSSLLLLVGTVAIPSGGAAAETTPKVVSRQHTQIRRSNAAERRKDNDSRSFKSTEGTPTLTNRGSKPKYKNKDEYEEVKIHFQPITSDPKWRKKKRPQGTKPAPTMTYGSEELRSIISAAIETLQRGRAAHLGRYQGGKQLESECGFHFGCLWTHAVDARNRRGYGRNGYLRPL